MVEFNIYLMFKLYKLFFNCICSKSEFKFHEKTYFICIILLVYINY